MKCQEPKFFRCEICGNFVGTIHSSGVPMVCCGQEMTELKANTVDAATEKHVPVIKQDGNTVSVRVGSVDHPMLEEHHIEFVYLLTEKGGQRNCLTVGKEPATDFALTDGDKVIAAYEYCNLHGLWKAEVE